MIKLILFELLTFLVGVVVSAIIFINTRSEFLSTIVALLFFVLMIYTTASGIYHHRRRRGAR